MSPDPVELGEAMHADLLERTMTLADAEAAVQGFVLGGENRADFEAGVSMGVAVALQVAQQAGVDLTLLVESYQS